MYFIQLGESSQNVDHTLNVLDLNARGSDHLLDEVLHLDLVLVHALAPHLHPQHVEEDVAEEEDGAGVEIRVERLQHNTRVPRLASPHVSRLSLCSLVPGGLPEVDALRGDHDEAGDDDDGGVEPRHRVTHRLLGEHQVRRRPGPRRKQMFSDSDSSLCSGFVDIWIQI